MLKKALFKDKFMKNKGNFKFETVKTFLNKKFQKECIYNFSINKKKKRIRYYYFRNAFL